MVAGAGETVEEPYQRILFTDNALPGAQGNVPTRLQSISVEDQRKAALNLHNFLLNTDSQLLELNADTTTPYSVLVHIPNTSKVQVCYGLGVGASGIGQTSPLSGYFLGLTGDGGKEASIPTTIMFKTTRRNTASRGTMTENQFKAALTAKGKNYTWPLVATAQVSTQSDTMSMAAVPPYLVYDGFENQLDAADVYERLMTVEMEDAEAMVNHLKNFLLACLQSHTQNNPSPSISMEEVMKIPPTAAKEWAKQKFLTLFPEFNETSTTPATSVAEIVASILPVLQQHQKPAEKPTGDEEKSDATTSLNMSTQECNQLCLMCGLADESCTDLLPKWIRDCAAKGMTDVYRQNIIRDFIQSNQYYDDAEVPLTSVLLKMIYKRNWVGRVGNLKKPAMADALEGLSPFTCAYIDDDVVAQMNAEEEYLEMAKSSTLSDVTKVKKSMKPVVPSDFHDFITMLKAFANLLFALFSSTCPFFRALKSIITALKDFSRPAREGLSLHAKAATLWIVLLQSRQFASGNMNLLLEFQSLQTDLVRKNVTFSHAELPLELITANTPKADGKRQANENNQGQHVDKKPKKTSNPNNWHPKLKSVLTPVLEKAKHPTLTACSKYCNFNMRNLFTSKDGRCTSNTFFGKCKDGDQCTRTHRMPTDAEAEKVLTLLEPLLKNPAGILNQGSAPQWIPSTKFVSTSTFLQTADKHLHALQKAKNPTLSSRPTVIEIESDDDKDAMEISSDEDALSDTEVEVTTYTPHEYGEKLKQSIENSAIFPAELPIKDEIGKLPLMHPRPEAFKHPAAPLLQQYADHGCPVDCGPNWTTEKILLLLQRGPHPSANEPDAIDQLRAETKDKVKHHYARVVKWGDIKNNIPPKLKISPVAMIPHKSKAYRCILDLSFSLLYKGERLTSVNDSTVKLAKPQAMVQLGQSLKRIIAMVADAWAPNNPFLFAKLDIKDGFWRMAVNNDDAWNFCYVLPPKEPAPSLDDIELVVPNSLQMGWCESPPFFCSGTETARDIIEANLALPPSALDPHRFEDRMLDKVNTDDEPSNASYIHCVEVFVDDFIGVAQTSNSHQLRHFSRAMLHGIHAIFPPPSITHHNGHDPVSEKKLDKGEGSWETTKEILGWIFDGKAGTMQLPLDKCKNIRTFINQMLRKSRSSLNSYQKLAGKLQHASLGMPGGKGLFSPLQLAMLGNPKFIELTDELKQTLRDWRSIIKYMENHPTSVKQLVLDYPSYLGYSDACKLGAGGVWCSGTETLTPVLWRVQWPKDIQNNLVSWDNPTGTITINDLELAGAVLNWLALESQGVPLQFKHVGTYCDNTSAVAWAYKLRTSASVRILDRVPLSAKDGISRDFVSAWTTIGIGVTPKVSKTREKYWKAWKHYATLCGVDPFLQRTNPLQRDIVVTAFAARVRTGAYGRGAQIRVQGVSDALAAVSKTIQLAGQQSPLYREDGKSFQLGIQRLLEGYRRQDPPAVPQLAVPITVPNLCFQLAQASSDPKLQATGQLALIAFYYLLRVGEYTKPRYVVHNGKRQKASRTVQFSVENVGFFKNGRLIPRTSSLQTLLECDAATLKITNQKNGKMGQTIHQEAVNKAECPVKALAYRVHHILSNGGTEQSLLCDYYVNSTASSVESKDIVSMIRGATKTLQLQHQAIDPDLVGAHSLRAGGAMALKLHGFDDTTIMKMGRWNSLTFTMYIHNQIAHLSKDVSKKMSMALPFVNIAAI